MTGYAVVPRDVVVVRGPDARSFLQALVSQDLDPLAPGDGAHSLLLTPQGKLTADFRLLVVADDEIWCDCERGFGTVLLESLQRFKIRVKADLERQPISSVVVRGDGVDQVLSDVAAPIPAAVPYAHVAWPARDARVVRSAEAERGLDVLTGDPQVPELVVELEAAGAVELSEAGYESARIWAGVVRQGRDVDETTIPQEAELERDAVSFTKGCFLGQELVCRIDSRGHVNRFVRRLVLDASASPSKPSIGSAVFDANGREVGRVTSVAGQLPVALATIRREVAPGDTVSADGVAAVVWPLHDDLPAA